MEVGNVLLVLTKV